MATRVEALAGGQRIWLSREGMFILHVAWEGQTTLKVVMSVWSPDRGGQLLDYFPKP